ncbi:MAG: hypothetical protein QOJ42_3125, partial [Acidobacteriaceae bacterium]|nr:hypothetical protein [Acidobacteriaceae bacterium]
HMFVMRYLPEDCDGLPFEDFINAVQQEGAPVYRAYQASMSSQPAMQKLMERRPSYFRLLPTPVADQAADDTVYIPQDTFLGREADMADIAAAILKVERFYAPGNARVVTLVTQEPTVPTKAQSHSATIS